MTAKSFVNYGWTIINKPFTVMIQDGRNLNLEYHEKNILICAINCSKSKREAALRLGISERTIYRLIIKYKIVEKKGHPSFCSDGSDDPYYDTDFNL